MKKIQLILSGILLLIPFVYVGMHWSDFPDRIPIHFNATGEADGFGSKPFLWLLPIVNVIIWLLALFAYKIPQLLSMPYYNYDNVKHKKIATDLLGWMQLLIAFFITILSLQVSYAALGHHTSIPVIPIVIFIVLLILLLVYYGRLFKNTR